MKERATGGYRQSLKLMKRLSQLKPQKLDKIIHNLHITEFNKIDCLACANCCKTISPSISDSDIIRMASFMKLKIGEFTDKYLIPDKDEDYVFGKTPCPFLDFDNRCLIYEARPRACREYPHTDRKRMYQILDLIASNTKVCPAVFNIAEQLKMNFPE